MTQETYFYRESPDKTIAAICPLCFMTAASASNEADLQYLTSLHQCPTEASSRANTFTLLLNGF
jgi:hypothetical protein